MTNLTPRGSQRRTGRERRVRNIGGQRNGGPGTGDVEGTDALRHSGGGGTSHLPAVTPV